jgi:hypothetical protein
MKGITYQQNGAGLSGHGLKDLFSSVAMAEIFGAEAVYDESWNNQSIIPAEHAEMLLASQDDFKRAAIIRRRKKFWTGIPFKELAAAREIFDGMEDGGLLTLTNVFRIQPYQVDNWERKGLIPEGSYSRVISKLSQLYWGEEEPYRVDGIAIHVRRGEVGTPRHRHHEWMGGGIWNVDFYNGMVKDLRAEFPEKEIRVFSQKRNSRDLLRLGEGAELRLGDDTQLQLHFRELVTAEILIPANSGFSTWAAYLNTGTVRLYQAREVKHIEHTEYPPHFTVIS